MIEWNWWRWPWNAVPDDNKVSASAHRRVEKRLEDETRKVTALRAQIGALTRKVDELSDQIKLRDKRITTLVESETMLRSRVSAYTALFERKRLDNMAGLPETESE